MADDLGYADVSSYGARDYTTPNVDRLALEGLRFTQAYSNSANCSPTRTALITGRYQMRLPLGLEEPLGDTARPASACRLATRPCRRSSRKAGYGTTLVGKWHLGYLPDFSPLKSGYDHFFGIFGGSADYFNHGSKSPIPLYEQEVPVDRIGYMTNLLASVPCRRSSATHARRRRSCSACTSPRRTGLGRTGRRGGNRSASTATSATSMAARRRPMRRMVQSLDAISGACCRRSTSTGLARDTIVIFTSDTAASVSR